MWVFCCWVICLNVFLSVSLSLSLNRLFQWIWILVRQGESKPGNESAKHCIDHSMIYVFHVLKTKFLFLVWGLSPLLTTNYYGNLYLALIWKRHFISLFSISMNLSPKIVTRLFWASHKYSFWLSITWASLLGTFNSPEHVSSRRIWKFFNLFCN